MQIWKARFFGNCQTVWRHYPNLLFLKNLPFFHFIWSALSHTYPLVAWLPSSISLPNDSHRPELNYSSWTQWNRTSICLLLLRLTLRSNHRWMVVFTQIYHWFGIWGSKHLCLYLGSVNQHSGIARTPDFEIPQGGVKVYPDITHYLNNLLCSTVLNHQIW